MELGDLSRMDAATAALVEQHLPLVEQVVLRVSSSFPRFVDRGDLISAGTLGLVEAALRYDAERGIPFGGFAVQRIRGAVLDVARSADWVPRSTRELARDAEQATHELAVEHREMPDERQVAERLGVEPGDLRRMQERITLGVTRSLDRGGDLDHGEDADQMVDRTAPSIEELLENTELHGYLRAALDSLPERLRIITVGLYLENRTFDELAELLGVTPSRISQLRSDAIDMIRHGMESQFRPSNDERPKGRVAIRQARYASDIAMHSDMVARLSSGAQSTRKEMAWHEESMPTAQVPDTVEAWTGDAVRIA